jgi:hypothetical protein
MLIALFLTACGGGAGTSTNQNATPTAVCDPSDPSSFEECGTVLVGITDADGDFLNYTVTVSRLTLETANGRIVEVLPRETRINFTDYVDLTELVTAAVVPPATYVAGTISLDYADAEILVAAGDTSKIAVVTDLDDVPLQQADLRIVLSNRDQLTVVPGRAALLQLDFDLDASHTVDVAATPATAATELFIVAEVQPVDEKVIRVLLIQFDVGSPDGEHSAFRHGISSVDSQIHHHLLDLALIGANLSQSRAQVYGQVHRRPQQAVQHHLHLSCDRVEIQHPPFGRLAPTERQQLLCQLASTMTRTLDLLNLHVSSPLRIEIGERKVRVRQDH